MTMQWFLWKSQRKLFCKNIKLTLCSWIRISSKYHSKHFVDQRKLIAENYPPLLTSITFLQAQAAINQPSLQKEVKLLLSWKVIATAFTLPQNKGMKEQDKYSLVTQKSCLKLHASWIHTFSKKTNTINLKHRGTLTICSIQYL